MSKAEIVYKNHKNQKVEAQVVVNQQKQIEDIFTNAVDESEPLDEKSQKALNNANFDANAFTSSNKNEKIAKKTSTKKNNKNKGQDFTDYAQKNGIKYDIKYEENDLKTQKKPYVKKEIQNTGFNSNQNDNTNAQKPYENNNTDQKNEQTYQKKVKKPYNNNNNNTKKFNNYNNEGGNQNYAQSTQKQGSNKFDSFNYNMMFQNPYSMPNMSNPGKI